MYFVENHNSKDVRNTSFSEVLNHLLALDPDMKRIGDGRGSHMKLEFKGIRRIVVIPHSFKKQNGKLDILFINNVITFVKDSNVYQSIKDERENVEIKEHSGKKEETKPSKIIERNHMR